MHSIDLVLLYPSMKTVLLRTSQVSCKRYVLQGNLAAEHIQGQPLGFDTKYLALVDRNMQVRFSLKVVWEF